MGEDRDISRCSVEVARNHLERSEEGRKLLRDGRSLNEMTTPLAGLTDKQTRERKGDFVKRMKKMDADQLYSEFQDTMHSLQHRWTDPSKGTSELELRRILFEDEFGRRGI